MNIRVFSGTTVKECIKNASEALNIPKEQLEYIVIEEKKGFFKRYATIEVKEIISTHNENSSINDGEIAKIIDGVIKIENEKIIVKDSVENGKPAYIIPSENIKVFIDGTEIIRRTPVYENSKIDINIKNVEAQRLINLKISENKMEAMINIDYVPRLIYGIEDKNESNEVKVKTIIKSKIMPPKFTAEEIKKHLANNNIKYGIIEENLVKCTKEEKVENLIIAKGKKPIDGKDDIIEIKCQLGENKYVDVDSNKKIDYKAFGVVKAVKNGDIIAIKHLGHEGLDGIDITGLIKKHKIAKKCTIVAAEGCKLQENTIISNIDGKPYMKGNTFSVHHVHEITGDVELKTGNIKFVGDIIIRGNVNEGMKVEADNTILIEKNVADAVVIAGGDITIKGNVILSKVIGGKENINNMKQAEHLNFMKTNILELISNIKQIKEFHLMEKKISDGELIKILIESKFRDIIKMGVNLMNDILLNGEEPDELVYLIKNKIMGLSPLKIKNYEELNEIIAVIDGKLITLSDIEKLPININIEYCQDCTIDTTGNINITGKGQYVSEITAKDSVYFTKEGSIARGGTIKAKNEIKCKVVGSKGRVSTKLIVDKDGHIWADIAYPNTKFIVGKKEFTLDTPSRNIHVFINSDNDLIVDKLML